MRSNSGNVLFVILIGIALFAALGFAMTQGSRGGSAKIDKEKAVLYAAELVAYANEIQVTFDHLWLQNRQAPEAISLGSPITCAGLPSAPSCSRLQGIPPTCLDLHCRVFTQDGGVLKPRIFEEMVENYTLGASSGRPRPGHPAAYAGRVVGLGGAGNEILIQITGIAQQICDVINKGFNLPSTTTMATEGNIDTLHLWTDYTSLVNPTGILGDAATAIAGRRSGCYYATASGNVFFHVLHVR